MNDQIGLLRERWRCPTPGGKCGTEHCFVQANANDHFPLGFRELESWAAAIVSLYSLYGLRSDILPFWKLKGPQFSTIDTPPNNTLFDALDPRTVAAKSPLLQRRLQLNAQAEAKAVPDIHTHINIPPEIIRLLQPNARSPPPESRGAAMQPMPSTMLLPPSLKPGAKMSIEDFCNQFSLSVEIFERLRENGYSGSHVIQHIEIAELRMMAFKPGEIAELKEAVRIWAMPKET